MSNIPVPIGFRAERVGYKQAVVLQIDVENFEGMLDELLNEWTRRYEGYTTQGWIGLEVICYQWDYYLIGYRPLTDAEKASQKRRSQKAKEAAARRKAKKEAEERALLEKLKAKYEG